MIKKIKTLILFVVFLLALTAIPVAAQGAVNCHPGPGGTYVCTPVSTPEPELAVQAQPSYQSPTYNSYPAGGTNYNSVTNNLDGCVSLGYQSDGSFCSQSCNPGGYAVKVHPGSCTPWGNSTIVTGQYGEVISITPSANGCSSLGYQADGSYCTLACGGGSTAQRVHPGTCTPWGNQVSVVTPQDQASGVQPSLSGCVSLGNQTDGSYCSMSCSTTGSAVKVHPGSCTPWNGY